MKKKCIYCILNFVLSICMIIIVLSFVALVMHSVNQSSYLAETVEVIPEPIPESEQTVVTATVIETDIPYMELSDEDIYTISQVLYLEARGESIECQQAVVSVILNRMTTNDMTANEVIFDDNQFTTAKFIDKGNPSEEMIELVTNVITEGPTIPVYVTYFRAGHYHEWDNEYGQVVPYDKFDNTYFSYDVELKEEYEEMGEY